MRKIANPNFVYILTFSVPFLVYTLKWSTIYPELQLNLIIFYLSSFVLCAFLGFITLGYTKGLTYHTISISKHNFLVVIFLYIFYLVDIIYSGFVPLFAFSSGTNYGGSIGYGIPVAHVLAVTFNAFYALYTFHQFLSTKKMLTVIVYFLLLIPFVILLNRSMIMYVIIGSFFMYCLSVARYLIKKSLYIIIAALFSIYLFGYLGNLRSASGDSTFIPLSSGVTDQFLKGPVPNEFYWGYLYIGSPLANLQNNITLARDKYSDYTNLVVSEFLPDFIGKRLQTELSLKPRAFEQINPFLNVGTIYSRPFNYAGWGGIVLIFLYFITLMNLYFIVMYKSYTYGVTGIAMMLVAITLANFENTIQFSAYSFQLVYPLILSAIKGYKQKKKIVKPILSNESSF